LEKAGQTKILTIGSTAAPKPSAAKDSKADPTGGAKVTAAKAIQKTGESVPSADSAKSASAVSSGRNSASVAESKPTVVDIDAVAKEQEADVDEELLESMYGKVRYQEYHSWRLINVS
jgi:peptide chain release factor subunit 3